jgi:hypothetical protein
MPVPAKAVYLLVVPGFADSGPSGRLPPELPSQP